MKSVLNLLSNLLLRFSRSFSLGAFARNFTLDLRSLACMRVLLGITLVGISINYINDIDIFFSEKGVLIPDFGFSLISLHLFSSSYYYQLFLFVCLLLASCSLMVGYYTRVSIIICFILFVSARNAHVFSMYENGLYNITYLCLFWGLFVPLGARFSFDDALRKTQEDKPPSRQHNILTVPSVCLFITVMIFYFASGLNKYGEDYWPNGQIVYQVMHDPAFSTILSRIFENHFFSVTQMISYYVITSELLVPILMVIPLFLRFRPLLVGMLAILHVGFIFFMSLGWFPIICLAYLSSLLPACVWDFLGKMQKKRSKGLVVFYDKGCGFCRKMCLIIRTFLGLSHVPLVPAQNDLKMGPLLEKENSWIVKDNLNKLFFRFEAFIALLKCSIFYMPLAFVLKFRPLRKIGSFLYCKVANNRSILSGISEHIWRYREEPKNNVPTMLNIILILVLLIYVFHQVFSVSMWRKETNWIPQISYGKGYDEILTNLTVLSNFTRHNINHRYFSPGQNYHPSGLVYFYFLNDLQQWQSFYPLSSDIMNSKDPLFRFYLYKHDVERLPRKKYIRTLLSRVNLSKIREGIKMHYNNANIDPIKDKHILNFLIYSCSLLESNNDTFNENKQPIIRVLHESFDTKTQGQERGVQKYKVIEFDCHP